MIRKLEVDQSCGTEDNWNMQYVPNSYDLNISELPDIEVNKGVLVLKSKEQRSNSKFSSDHEVFPGDSMVSFDVQPVIQSTYKASDLDSFGPNDYVVSRNPNLSTEHSIDVNNDRMTPISRVLKSQARDETMMRDLGQPTSACRVASQGNNNPKRGQLIKGSAGSNAPVQTVIKNGQAVLITKAKMSTGRSSQQSNHAAASIDYPMKMTTINR